MFELTGTTRVPTGHRRVATLVWADGVFAGDGELVIEAERRAAAGQTVKATPSGPSDTAALAPARRAAILACSLFESFATSGDDDLFDDLLAVDDGAIP
ncbi:MAG TPA: hypothetical protein VNI55_01930 [Gaiellaceae bacterium]|nr:hypothetical protein [Gaiellaceae bacterium]